MASFYGGDHVGAVVVDIGAASTKMGWAGDDCPRSYFRSVRTNNLRVKEMGYELPVSGQRDVVVLLFSGQPCLMNPS